MPVATTTAKPAFARTRVVSRILLAVIGGYGVTLGLVAALSTGLVAAGMARSEAAMLTVMLGAAIYLVALVWGFSARRLAALAAIWALLAGACLGFAALFGSA